MKSLKVFMIGLIYGWFFKIAFDRIYRDNEVEDIRNENASLREHIHSLETQLKPKSLEAKSVKRTTSQAKPDQTTKVKDDLKVIKGIGPAIEKKLNNAGVQTYKALARLKREELEDILGSTSRLVQDEANLIAQARKLAQQTGRRS